MSELNEIATALAAAQAEMKNPALDSVNPHFKSKFANLASVRNAVVPVLAKHGLFLAQNLTNTERGIACTTIITHKSGQQMQFGPLEMPAMKPDAQGLGSAATYARRYAMMAALSIVGDEDDDGNAATKSNGKSTPVATITESQVADLDALIDEVKADRTKFLKHLKIVKLNEILAANYSTVVGMLEAKRVRQ
jgi:hypothetical protein